MRQALAYHLAQRIYVVSIKAHDIPVIMGIKIAYGQILHMVEHFLAHFSQHALSDNRHKLGIEHSREQAYKIQRY